MRRMLYMALAGVAGLAWVAFYSGPEEAVSGNRPALVEDATMLAGIGGIAPATIGGEFAPGPKVAGGDADESRMSQVLLSSRVPAGTSLNLSIDKFEFAAADFSAAGSLESSSSLMEPQWFAGRLSELQQKGRKEGEGALAPEPVIPEPAALLLLGAVFLALAAFGRKWKERKKLAAAQKPRGSAGSSAVIPPDSA
jgi:hypothetical protein